MGSITVGKRADLALVNSRKLGMLPVNDPLASPADVDTVIADGRIVNRAGQLIGMDLASLRAQAKAGAQQLLQKG